MVVLLLGRVCTTFDKETCPDRERSEESRCPAHRLSDLPQVIKPYPSGHALDSVMLQLHHVYQV